MSVNRLGDQVRSEGRGDDDYLSFTYDEEGVPRGPLSNDVLTLVVVCLRGIGQNYEGQKGTG